MHKSKFYRSLIPSSFKSKFDPLTTQQPSYTIFIYLYDHQLTQAPVPTVGPFVEGRASR